MLRDITIGQYYPSDSVLHKLDPRVKLAGTLLFVVSLFPYTNMTVYLITTLFLILMVTVSKVSWRYILKGLKPVMIIIFFTAFYNVLLTPGKNEIVTWGIIHISYVGLRKAFYMVLRLMYLIIGSSLMTYTTTPTKLTDGIEEALKPLNKLKVPVHEFAMMMSLALRFIPILPETMMHGIFCRIIRTRKLMFPFQNRFSLIMQTENVQSLRPCLKQKNQLGQCSFAFSKTAGE